MPKPTCLFHTGLTTDSNACICELYEDNGELTERVRRYVLDSLKDKPNGPRRRPERFRFFTSMGFTRSKS